MSVDPFDAIPRSVQYFDGFDDCILSTKIWNTKVENGSSLITEASKFLNIKNTGTGTAGISYLESAEHFPRYIRISVDINPYTFSGNHVEGSLVLYKDANNWLKFGIYKDVSEGIDSQAYLRACVAGVTENQILDITAITADTNLTYTLVLLEHHIMVYCDDVYLTGFEWEEMINYHIRLEAGTESNTDAMHIKFNDFEAYQNFDFATMRIGQHCKMLRLNPGNNTLLNSSFSLADTTAKELEFLTTDYGKLFRLTLSIALDDFDVGAVALSSFTVKIFRKIGGAYKTLPSEIYTFVQGSLSVDAELDVFCHSDTKVVCNLSAIPAASITFLYTGCIQSR